MPFFPSLSDTFARIRRGVRPAAATGLEEGARKLRDALAAGTPVRTGATASAWSTTQTGELEHRIANPLPHVVNLPINITQALEVVEATDDDLANRINAVIGGRSG